MKIMISDESKTVLKFLERGVTGVSELCRLVGWQ